MASSQGEGSPNGSRRPWMCGGRVGRRRPWTSWGQMAMRDLVGADGDGRGCTHAQDSWMCFRPPQGEGSTCPWREARRRVAVTCDCAGACSLRRRGAWCLGTGGVLWEGGTFMSTSRIGFESSGLSLAHKL